MTMDELWEAFRRYEAELRASGRTIATVNTYGVHVRRFLRWLEEHPKVTK